MPILQEILAPFNEQFKWNKTDKNDFTLEEALKEHPMNASQDEVNENYSHLERPPGYPFRLWIGLATALLRLGHMLCRGPIGLIGDIFEGIEKRVAFPPLKLLFYLLKQPFRWAATAISSAFLIADSVLSLVYAASAALCSLMYRDQDKRDMASDVAGIVFKNSIKTLKLAVPRLFLTGLIGAAAYFLAPLGVTAFAGTLGTVGAAFAVAAIGTVGVTAIQAAAFSINKRCSPPGGGGGSTGMTMDSLGIQPGTTNSDADTESVVAAIAHWQNQQPHSEKVKGFLSDSSGKSPDSALTDPSSPRPPRRPGQQGSS